MKLILENDELDKLYRFAANLRSPAANKIFNLIFSKKHHPKITPVSDGNTTTVTFDKSISIPILSLLEKYGFSMGNVLQASGLKMIGEAKALFQNIGPDFLKVFKDTD